MRNVASLFKKERKVYKKGTLEEIYFNYALKDEEYWTREDLKNAKNPADRARLQERLMRIYAAQEKEKGRQCIVQTIISSDSFDVLSYIENFQREQALKKAKNKAKKPLNVVGVVEKFFRGK